MTQGFCDFYDVSLEKIWANYLDDKKLIVDFENVIKYGTIDDEPIKGNKENLQKYSLFICYKHVIYLICLLSSVSLQVKTKRVNGVFKELQYLDRLQKKAYYSNTLLKCDYERKETYAPRNKECLMIQSMAVYHIRPQKLCTG